MLYLDNVISRIISICHYLGLTELSTSTNAASVSWTEFSHEDTSEFKEYIIQHRCADCSDYTYVNSIMESPPYEVTGLDSTTEYDILVQVNTYTYGKSVFSTPIKIKTNPSEPNGKYVIPNSIVIK